MQALQAVRLSEALRLRPDMLIPEIYFSEKKWGMGLEFREAGDERGDVLIAYPE